MFYTLRPREYGRSLIRCGRPEVFAGQRVVVVGLGNSGPDVCHELIGHASSISISHNHGAVVVSTLIIVE